MKTSDKGIDFIKQYEGYRALPYKDTAGLWTVGYGHLMKSGDGTVVGSPITMGQAKSLLQSDLSDAEAAVNAIGVPLEQNEFDALVSFTYNLGVGALKMSSSVKALKIGDKQSCANDMLLWNRVRNPKTKILEVSPPIARRRQAEKDMFLKGSYNVI